MKYNLQSKALVIIFGIIAIFQTNAQAQREMVRDSVTMGTGYANEIYYNMQSGQVSSYPRNSWDIAIRTRIMPVAWRILRRISE